MDEIKHMKYMKINKTANEKDMTSKGSKIQNVHIFVSKLTSGIYG